jgi:alkylation response protein AidB-like acyl-CoA dehydrogenase
MDFELTREQEAVRAMAREWALAEVAPVIHRYDEAQEFPSEILKSLGRTGLLGALVPEEYGGAALDYVSYALAVEELNRVDASVGITMWAHNSLCTNHITLFGSKEQKAAYLPRLARGESLGAWGLTEPGSGSDAAAMRSEARREGDEYVLDGSKRFITNAGVAGLYVVFAKTDPGVGHKGISAFVVEGDAPGLEIGRIEPKMGIKGSTTGEVFLTGCRVPAANRLGEEGEGWRLAMRILDRSRPGIAAQALGIAEGATDYALEYARTRETMGEPIASHQLVAGMLADMETRCEAARGLLYRCGAVIDSGADGPELTKLSAITKLFCSDTAMAVTTDAVQVLGGYGYMKEYPVERMMRDAKITQIYEGTNQVQRLVIAREMVREGRGTPFS